jgi:DNA polymerase I-like protein with 3'-5' exonuclease and polymerase domains
MRLLFDIETDNYLEHCTVIHCIVTKNVDTNEVQRFRPQEIKRGLKFLQAAKVLIGHNIIDFDIRAIKKLYPKWDHNAEIYDTLIAAKLAYPDIKNRDFKRLRSVMNKDAKNRTQVETMRMRNIGKHSLEAYGLRMGNHKGDFGKEVGFDKFSEAMLEYCVQDCEVNTQLFHRLEKEDISQVALETELESQRICIEQTTKGFNFNIDKAHDLHKTLMDRRAELTELIEADLGGDFLINLGVKVPKRTTQYKEILRGRYTQGAAYTKIKRKEFNPNSRYDLGQRLISRFNWKPKEFGTDNKPTLSEEILDKMKFPVSKHISEYLMIDKRLGMLSNGNNAWIKLYNEETKSIHGRVNTLGAGTGRCTHSKPNLAQIPSVRSPYGKECRGLFEAPEGMKLFGTDASGLELRMLAHYMFPFDNGEYADVVLNGDIHTVNQEAAELPTRDMAKEFIYSKIYGSGIQGLADTCGVSVASMKKTVASFDKNLPALVKLTEAVKYTIRTKGYVKALDGRKIFCSSEHAALNYLLQSAGAIVCKNWMNEIHRILEDEYCNYSLSVKQLAFVHDELQIGYNPVFISHEELDEISKRAMTNTEKKLGIKLKLDSDSNSGSNYAETH